MDWGYGDYIKREDALDITSETSALTAQGRIMELPSADVCPVVHGKWLLRFGGSGTCSMCGASHYSMWDDEDTFFNYCPICGAKMDEIDAMEDYGDERTNGGNEL